MISKRSQQGKLKTLSGESHHSHASRIVAIMKPYQLRGLSFLVYLHRNGLSGILGDEMGLGKTLQTLALIQWTKENCKVSGTGKESRPSLVVCPTSVLDSWLAEARKWAPALKVIRFHGTVAERKKLKKKILGLSDPKPQHAIHTNDYGSMENAVGLDLVITTYETFVAEQVWLNRSFVWSYVSLRYLRIGRDSKPVN